MMEPCFLIIKVTSSVVISIKQEFTYEAFLEGTDNEIYLKICHKDCEELRNCKSTGE